ncbi:hypothetical protein TDB9533_01951 [Thalassocella blandensis]|nr:hypothetical protein TDB9533_01951 [Thalassocella blandensis]
MDKASAASLIGEAVSFCLNRPSIELFETWKKQPFEKDLRKIRLFWMGRNSAPNKTQNQIACGVDCFDEITDQESTSVNYKVFIGQEHETETDLIYIKSRFYDPDFGSFISEGAFLGVRDTLPSLHGYL